MKTSIFDAIRFNRNSVDGLFAAVLFSVLYFVFFTSWGGFVDELVDRNVYVEQFSTGNVSSNYLEFDSIVNYLTNEWLWNAGIYRVVQIAGDVNYVLHGLSLFIVFVFGSFIIRNGGVFYLIFLLTPLFFDLVFSQIRIGVAFSLLMVAYDFKRFRFVVFLFCLGAALIHTSSVLFVAIYLALKFTPSRYEYLFVVLIALMVSVILGPLREYILNFIGDRRAVYGDMSSSVFYMSYWWGLLILFIMSGLELSGRYIIGMAVVLLGIACFNQLFGFYSTRFLAVGLPLVACAVSRMRTNAYYYLAIVGFVLYVIFQWFYWFVYSYQ